MPTSIANHIISFYKNLQPPTGLPSGIEVLHPQKNEDVKKIIKAFYSKYFDDKNPRNFIIGINPGRFGAGITGINFTAPKQLTENCHLPHSFKMQSELSAEFIYEVIDAFGGCEVFYHQFYLASVSPLGFVKDGINLNYYDDPDLKEAIKPFAEKMLIEQTAMMPVNRKVAICLGGEKNYKFLDLLNRELKLFEKILPLPHPRFVMQYKRKNKQAYIKMYLDAFATCMA